jgi:ABC-type lipoprotein release transport system permease subunit
MFVLEAFCLGVIGTTLGMLLGSLGALAVNALHVAVPEGAQFFTMSSTLKFGFEPARILGGAVVITACTTLISIIPSLRAARMKPVSAMSHI